MSSRMGCTCQRGVRGREGLFREHLQLRSHATAIASARILGFEIPWTVEQIDAACQATVAKNGFTDAYVRPIAWRGSEEMGVAAQHTKIHLAIATWEWGA